MSVARYAHFYGFVGSLQLNMTTVASETTKASPKNACQFINGLAL